ncbi:TPA: DNA-binding response regulator [Candidatus Sumerlaeota bacterium]|nr:DNA-binding response regulator [Candidatus Sumerlaeota bacterium]
MKKHRILIVEDEEDIRELVRYNLSRKGYEVITAATGEEGLRAVRENEIDLLVLDLMLPKMSGLELCRLLKDAPGTRDIPVLILSAMGEEPDIVRGLEYGAEDYVTKPFSVPVLLARIKALLRRVSGDDPATTESDVINYKGLEIHPGRHDVKVNGEAIVLTLSEFRILHFLARKPGWVFTRSQIVAGAHDEKYGVTDRSIDVQIVSLRRKLGDASDFIETVRGVGYRFKE